MTEVVINATYGGFSISEAALEFMRERENKHALREVGWGEKWCKNTRKRKGEKKHVCVPRCIRGIAPDGSHDELMEDLIKVGMAHYTDGSGDKTREESIRQLREDESYGRDFPRDDPDLVAAVKALGADKAGGRHASLKIVRIPHGVKFVIDEYDGAESIHEKHRSWG
jgi:hypothetical protein